MNLPSIILLSLILLWIIAAIVYLIHRRGAPCCGGAGCSGSCSHCNRRCK